MRVAEAVLAWGSFIFALTSEVLGLVWYQLTRPIRPVARIRMLGIVAACLTFAFGLGLAIGRDMPRELAGNDAELLLGIAITIAFWMWVTQKPD